MVRESERRGGNVRAHHTLGRVERGQHGSDIFDGIQRHSLKALLAPSYPQRLASPWQDYYWSGNGFNQPLAWDVSSVTSMKRMFQARSAACLCTACSKPAPAMQDSSRLSLSTSPYLTWQYAEVFNQPLAWDVSSVTNINQMFLSVRSAAFELLPATSLRLFRF